MKTYLDRVIRKGGEIMFYVFANGEKIEFNGFCEIEAAIEYAKANGGNEVEAAIWYDRDDFNNGYFADDFKTVWRG